MSNRFACALLITLASRIVLAHEEDEKITNGTTAPALIERHEPVYPEAARKAGLGGTVSLQIEIDAEGKVTEVKVLRAAGRGFDEAAVEAARGFLFRPATQNGKPIASTVLFEQIFNVRPHLSAEVAAEPHVEAPEPKRPTVEPEHPVEPAYASKVKGTAPRSAATASSIRSQDFELRPMTSPNDLLRVVPGLMAVQHQGGGKADQLFLRGFDADHGTDVAVFVDGVPINLPSHAHGQGYTDLHFILPEAIERIDVVKGPYDARYGDFATAGAVNLVTRNSFDSSMLSFTVGGFPTRGCSGGISQCKLVAQERLAAVISPKLGGWADKLHPWVAAEVARDQGPFDSPEGMLRYSVFAKIGYDITPRDKIGLFLSVYGSKWNGSGQIPSREVDSGRLDRFGSIDPSEGGITQRQQLNLYFHHKDPKNEFDATVYFTRYRLSLWNNFTFFLADPQHGDEIEQDDARFVAGGNLAFHRHDRWRGIAFRTTIGLQARYDGVHVDVWNVTSQDGDYRKRLSRRTDPSSFHFGNDSDMDALNIGAFIEEDVLWRRWFRSIVAVRADYFGWNVNDQSETLGAGVAATSGGAQKMRTSPKATLVFMPHRMVDLYLNFGMGFHSNDARISVQSGRATPDGPVKNVLPAIYAGEVGARFTYKQYLSIAAAVWASYLESETVFRGDDAAFEPSDPTRRIGVDVEVRAQPIQYIDLDLDVAQAASTALRPGGGSGQLALAPRLYITGGVGAKWRGLRAGLRFRYVGARPAFDTDSAEYQMFNASDPRRVNTEAYFVLDAYGAYRWRWLEAGFSIQNLANTAWREAQFGNASCTSDEAHNPANANFGACGATLAAAQRKGIPDVHFTPGVPFNLSVNVKAYF